MKNIIFLAVQITQSEVENSVDHPAAIAPLPKTKTSTPSKPQTQSSVLFSSSTKTAVTVHQPMNGGTAAAVPTTILKTNSNSSSNSSYKSSNNSSQLQPQIRIFVALFDYDPETMSPNPDSCDEELPFR